MKRLGGGGEFYREYLKWFLTKNKSNVVKLFFNSSGKYNEDHSKQYKSIYIRSYYIAILFNVYFVIIKAI